MATPTVIKPSQRILGRDPIGRHRCSATGDIAVTDAFISPISVAGAGPSGTFGMNCGSALFFPERTRDAARRGHRDLFSPTYGSMGGCWRTQQPEAVLLLDQPPPG